MCVCVMGREIKSVLITLLLIVFKCFFFSFFWWVESKFSRFDTGPFESLGPDTQQV